MKMIFAPFAVDSFDDGEMDDLFFLYCNLFVLWRHIMSNIDDREKQQRCQFITAKSLIWFFLFGHTPTIIILVTSYVEHLPMTPAPWPHPRIDDDVIISLRHHQHLSLWMAVCVLDNIMVGNYDDGVMTYHCSLLPTNPNHDPL